MSGRRNPESRETERGTILLTTLMIMALMAALSIAVMDDIRLAAKRMINTDAARQADWTARSTEDFAQDYLANDFGRLPAAAKNAAVLSGDPILFPTDRGIVSLSLSDSSTCFNLNSLRQASGVADDTARREFLVLMELLGLTRAEATRVAAEAADWVDADQTALAGGAEDGDYLRRDPPYRTANTSFASVGELRALLSMTDEVFETLRPFVCIGAEGVRAPLNVNAVDARSLALLAARLGGVDKAALAQSLIESRPLAGYADLDELPLSDGAAPAEDGTDTQTRAAELALEPPGLILDVRVDVGPVQRRRILRYDGLGGAAPELTYRGWDLNDFRPMPIRETSGETTP